MIYRNVGLKTPYTEEWGTREPQIPKRAVSALQETTYVLSM